MNFPTSLCAAVLAAGVSFSAQATTFTIDLTDNSFTPGSVDYLFPDTTGPIFVFGETVGGVNFTFTSPGLAAQNFSTMGPWSGGEFETGTYALSFGGAGNSSTSFTMRADADVTLTGFLGFNQNFTNAVIFDVTGAGVTSTGNGFTGIGFLAANTPALENFANGPLALQMGESYTFQATNAGAATLGYFTGFEFRVAENDLPPIPLPAAGWLLLSALGGLCVMCRRRTA